MYFIAQIILAIIIFSFLLYLLYKSIIEKKIVLNRKFLNIMILFIVITTTITIGINCVSYFKTKNKLAIKGNKGIQGKVGKRGKKGFCDNKCGKNVCYINVKEACNEKLNKLLEPKFSSNYEYKEIKNKQFLKLINKICFSDQYFSILTTPHKNKPTEIKLINHIKNILETWVEEIFHFNPDNKAYNDENTLQQPLGLRYFLESNLRFEDFNDKIDTDYKTEGKQQKWTDIIKDIKKYDIYKWTQDDIIIRKKIEIKTNNLSEPEPYTSQLYSKNTNNYHEKVYDTTMKNDVWDTTFCNNNQMGEDKSNPNNLDKCVYIDKRNQTKTYKNTWKDTVYNKPKELSLYNTKPYTNRNNQKFYPVGSIWTGKNNPINNEPIFPKEDYSDNFKSFNKKYENIGPKKDTLLVSGDVTSPEDYKKIWDSDAGCNSCQDQRTIIYRPIPKKGYTCLGDVAIKVDKKFYDNSTTNTTNPNSTTNTTNMIAILEKEEKQNREKLDALEIKCVPNKCVQKKKIGNKVWDNRNVSYEQYNNYNSYKSKTPFKYQKPLNVSLWSAGASNAGEEYNNNYGVDLKEDDGYNLFRASQYVNEKPKLDTYILNQKCLMKNEGKTPAPYQFNTSNITEDSSTTTKRYETSMFFGVKPSQAILTNSQVLTGDERSINNIDNKPIKLILEDDLNKRKTEDKDTKPDSYFIKTLNKDKNDFSNCIVSDYFGNVKETNQCNKDNKYHKWNVDYDPSLSSDPLSSAKVNLKTHEIIKTNEKDSDNKFIKKYQCLNHYYDNLGKSQFELTNCSDNRNDWNYDTLAPSILPIPNKKLDNS